MKPADTSNPRPGPSRRAVLHAAGSTGGLAVTGAALKPEDALSEPQREMVLQLAKAGAVYPMEPPSFGEPGTAMSRATMKRLKEAEANLKPERAALVRQGAQALIAQGLLGVNRNRLLTAVGKAAGRKGDHQELIAAVQLAVATVMKHFDPNRDHPANIWVELLGRLHKKGVQPRPLRHVEEGD